MEKKTEPLSHAIHRINSKAKALKKMMNYGHSKEEKNRITNKYKGKMPF